MLSKKQEDEVKRDSLKIFESIGKKFSLSEATEGLGWSLFVLRHLCDALWEKIGGLTLDETTNHLHEEPSSLIIFIIIKNFIDGSSPMRNMLKDILDKKNHIISLCDDVKIVQGAKVGLRVMSDNDIPIKASKVFYTAK